MSKPTDLVLIWSDYHTKWWSPDGAGYTDDMAYAGVYTREAAQSRTCEHEDRDIIREPKHPSVTTPLADEIKRVQERLAKLYALDDIAKHGKPGKYAQGPGGHRIVAVGCDLDEFVARMPRFVHLEQMSDDHWWMNVELSDGTRHDINLAGRAATGGGDVIISGLVEAS